MGFEWMGFDWVIVDMTKSSARTNSPLAYLITFTTYGTWLHGKKAGSIWKDAGESNTTLLGSNPELEISELGRLKNPPFVMNAKQRERVLESILEVCHFRNWQAYAVHVRANHIHAVVSAKAKPEKIMSDFKAYATKTLKTNTTQTLPKKRWTRHGSTRYLWSEQQLSDAVKYVRDQQGKMMAFGQTISKDEDISKPRPWAQGP